MNSVAKNTSRYSKLVRLTQPINLGSIAVYVITVNLQKWIAVLFSIVFPLKTTHDGAELLITYRTSQA